MKFLSSTFLLLALTACAKLGIKRPSSQKNHFVFKQDAELQIDGKKEKVGANQKFEVKSLNPVLVRSKGKIPFLIYPIESVKDFEVDLPDLDRSSINQVQNQIINEKLDTLLPGIQQVQLLILKKDYSNALATIKDLKAQFPGVAFLSFIEGSCYAVLKRRSEALQALREGLAIYPDSVEAKYLYDKMSKEKL